MLVGVTEPYFHDPRLVHIQGMCIGSRWILFRIISGKNFYHFQCRAYYFTRGMTSSFHMQADVKVEDGVAEAEAEVNGPAKRAKTEASVLQVCLRSIPTIRASGNPLVKFASQVTLKGGLYFAALLRPALASSPFCVAMTCARLRSLATECEVRDTEYLPAEQYQSHAPLQERKTASLCPHLSLPCHEILRRFKTPACLQAAAEGDVEMEEAPAEAIVNAPAKAFKPEPHAETTPQEEPEVRTAINPAASFHLIYSVQVFASVPLNVAHGCRGQYQSSLRLFSSDTSRDRG